MNDGEEVEMTEEERNGSAHDGAAPAFEALRNLPPQDFLRLWPGSAMNKGEALGDLFARLALLDAGRHPNRPLLSESTQAISPRLRRKKRLPKTGFKL